MDDEVYTRLPKELMLKFEESSFCPGDAIRGRPETGTSWNTIKLIYDERERETDMYFVTNWNGELTEATRPFGHMNGAHDAQFVKAVIEWFQSMTQAKAGS
jgi:hypothetical protein